MAALDFPNSPSVNDIYSANGKQWQWNGTKWVSLESSIVVAWPDGTATGPGAYFASDIDTGLWRPAANTLGVSVGGAEIARVTSAGFLGIGATGPNATLTVSENATLLPTVIAGTMVHIGNADAQTNRLLMEGFGNGVSVNFRRANNTNASPTALAADDAIGSFITFGHDGVAYTSSPRSGFINYAGGNWTAASHPTYISIYTTPVSTTSIAERMRIGADGGVNIGGATNAVSTALLELTSTTRGLLLPRMTTVQRDAISSPPDGMLVFNSTNLQVESRQNTNWSALSPAALNMTVWYNNGGF